MKIDGLFSFQMAIHNKVDSSVVRYYDNNWDAQGTNGACDVSVDNPTDLINDLTKIGFKNISYEIKPEWDANIQKYLNSDIDKWIYVKAFK